MWDFILDNWYFFVGGIALIVAIVCIILLIREYKLANQEPKTTEEKQPEAIASNEDVKNEEVEEKQPAEEKTTSVKAENKEKAETEPKKEEQTEVKEQVEPKAEPKKEKTEPKAEPKKEAKEKTTEKNTQAKTAKPKQEKVEKAEQPAQEKKQESTGEDMSEAKTKNQKYMVIYDKEKKDWIVKKTGAGRASKRCRTKKEALEVAERLAESQDLNLTVKKKDGKFQKKY